LLHFVSCLVDALGDAVAVIVAVFSVDVCDFEEKSLFPFL
jgi:hypothetical protein